MKADMKAGIWNKRNAVRAGILILAALLLAAGVEWLTLRTLPPVFVDAEVDISYDPTLIERGTTWMHPSGRPALTEEWNLARFLALFLIQLFLLILLFPLGLGKRAVAGLQRGFLALKRTLTEEKARNLKLLCAFAGLGTAVFFLARAWILDAYQLDTWLSRLLCALMGLSAGCLVAFPRTLGKKPEVFFLVLTLMYGGFLCWALPAATGVSLDDGYHFQHALNYSTLGHVRFTGAEWDAMQADNEREYRLDHLDAFRAAQDEKHARGAVFVTTGFHPDPKEYWMATHGLGLFLGRVLGLGFWDTWSLGRFTGLAAYALIGYFAIRRLKSGRMILALSLMIPSSVFLAANYSYDPGVTAGITLSCACWIAQWQERNKTLKNGDVAVMIAGMLFACYAKAIYFPIFLLFLFLPGSKFRSRRHRAAYTAVILASMVLVMLYILLPLRASGGQGDDRASGDVNTFGQLDFILSRPLDYALILWHFLREYLDPARMNAFLNSFGYMGTAHYQEIILIVLAVATFTDQAEEGLLPPAWIRSLGLALLFGSLLLMITSMYVWFSEVGSASFDGMQARYLLPFAYPAMALMGSNRSRNQMNPALYHGLLFAGMLFAAFSGILFTCVEYYR